LEHHWSKGGCRNDSRLKGDVPAYVLKARISGALAAERTELLARSEAAVVLPAAAAVERAMGPTSATTLSPAAVTIPIVLADFLAEYLLLCCIAFSTLVVFSLATRDGGTLSTRHSTVNQTDPVCVANVSSIHNSSVVRETFGMDTLVVEPSVLL
jgi:hypothetical protein